MLLNNQKITEEITEETKKYLETNDNENTMTQNLWYAAKASSKREVYSNTILPQETKISNKQPNPTPKAVRERTTTTTKNTPKLAEGKKS